MWDVIEKCDFRFFLLQKIFLWIRFRDHAWSFHRLCFDCSTRVFSKWWTRSNSIFRDNRDLTKRLIKLEESDSSNLTKAIHQTWYERLFIKSDRRHLVKRDELYLIKSDERHFIKSDERHLIKHDERHLIKFWERKTILLFSNKSSHTSTHDMKNLIWQKIIFVQR
jgi:hypothetical protein